MYIYLTIFTLISIFLIGFHNNLLDEKKKIHLSFSTLSYIAFPQMILSVLLQLTNVNFNIFTILSFMSIFISNVLLVSYMIYNIHKHKANIDLSKNNLLIVAIQIIKQNIISIILLLTYAIIIIFITNKFVDTGLYLSLSQNFRNSILPSLQDPYRYSVSYYIYSSISITNTIPIYFNFLTPFIFFSVLITSINNFILDSYKNKVYFIQTLFLSIATLLSIFFVPTTISGNMYIQANLLILIILCVINKYYYMIPAYLLFAQFFSITGFILSFIIVIIFILYFVIFAKNRDYYKWLIYLGISLFCLGPTLPLSFGSFSKYVSFFNILFMIISLLSISIGILLSFLMYKKDLFNESKRIFDMKIFKNNYIFWTLLIATLILSLFTIVYFGIYYKDKQYYSIVLMFVCFVFFSGLIGWNIIKYKWNTNEYIFILCFSIIIVGLLSILLLISNVSNASIWRINYVSITLPLPESSITIIMLVILLLSNALVNNNYIKNAFAKISNKPRLYKASTYMLFGFSILASFIPIIWSQTTTAIIRPELINFSSNVTTNINLLDNKDIEILEQINNRNSQGSITYATDNESTMYLNKNVTNETVNVAKKIYSSYTLTDERYWNYTRLNFYNARLNNKDIQNLKIDEFINLFNTYLTNLDVDVLILDMNSEYFNKLTFNNLKIFKTKTLAFIYK